MIFKMLRDLVKISDEVGKKLGVAFFRVANRLPFF